MYNERTISPLSVIAIVIALIIIGLVIRISTLKRYVSPPTKPVAPVVIPITPCDLHKDCKG